MNKPNTKPKGFMALMNVLIVSSISLVVLTSLSSSLYTENQIIIESVNANNAYYLAHACAEEGLMRVRRDLNYTEGTITLDAENQCKVEITKLWEDYTLVAEGNSYEQTQKIQIKFKINTETGLLWGDNNHYDRNTVNISIWEKI